MQPTESSIKRSSAHKNSTAQSALLEIKREFQAPVSQLFDAFKTSDALKVWWWPKDLYTDRVEIQFREGGRYFINMKGYDKGGGGMTGQFEEIVEPKRIVMTDHFCDKDGKPISPKEAGMSGSWPEVVYITFEFDHIDTNTSRLSLYQEGIPTEFQRECIQGWNESFDKLEKYLGHPN